MAVKTSSLRTDTVATRERRKSASSAALAATSRPAKPEMADAGAGDEILMQLRSLLFGGVYDNTEAQYETLVDVLEEHTHRSTNQLQALEGRVRSLAGENMKLGKDYATLDDAFSQFITRASREREAIRSTFEDAIRNLQAEMDNSVEALTKSAWTRLRDTESVTRRAVNQLSDEAGNLRKAALEDARSVHDSTVGIVEQRIAQWRAEIEDSRKEDSQKMASSILALADMLTVRRR